MVVNRFELLRNKSVALLTHIAATDHTLWPTAKHFVECKNFDLKLLIAPEHGLFNALQDQVYVKNIERKRIPVISVYGEKLSVPPNVLRDIDVLVIDLIDIGTRYYTFVWSAILLIKQMKNLNKRILILDRPNPLNGITIQGPILDDRFSSFVGLYSIPVRHGMTIGEICHYINNEYSLNANLEVIKMKGWKREYYFPECHLPWTVPSPNMPSFETAYVYPGMCLLEGTNISEGRGSTRPFEVFGAPWIEEEELVKELISRKIPGVNFRPLKFIPTFHKYKNRVCGGAQIYIRDLKKLDPVYTGLEIISAIRNLYPKRFTWRKPPYEFEKEKMPFDILIGNSWIRKAIEKGESVISMKKKWQRGIEAFKKKRHRYLFYK